MKLWGNNIRWHGAKELAPILIANKNIKNLQINHNDIGTSGVGTLIRAIKELKQLQTLELEGNGIDKEGAALIASASRELPSLGVIQLAFNDIDADGALNMARVVSTGLHKLRLSYNPIRFNDYPMVRRAFSGRMPELELTLGW